MSYHLTVTNNRAIGGPMQSPILGAIDDKELTTNFPYDVEPMDFLEASGTLLPGQHTFLMRGNSITFKNGAPVAMFGEVKLELRASPAAAVPLPTGVLSGIAMLAVLLVGPVGKNYIGRGCPTYASR